MDGWEIRLRAQGAGRFFVAGFLSLWLCGWVAGEGAALWMLYRLVRGALTGEPSAVGSTSN